MVSIAWIPRKRDNKKTTKSFLMHDKFRCCFQGPIEAWAQFPFISLVSSKSAIGPAAVTINQDLGQQELTLPRVIWKIPHYWLVVCANGCYWLASTNLRVTLQHVTVTPPPYKHGTHSDTAWSLVSSVREHIHLLRNRRIKERWRRNYILM